MAPLVAEPLFTALHLACRLEFMAEKDMFSFWPDPPVAFFVVLGTFAASPVFCCSVLRCWNFSRIEESLLWYWLMRSVEVVVPAAAGCEVCAWF